VEYPDSKCSKTPEWPVAYSQSTGFVPISHLVTTVCSNDPPDALRTRRGTPPADP
jgi:hypothetical protein